MEASSSTLGGNVANHYDINLEIKRLNSLYRIVPGILVVGFIVLSGYKKRSLSLSGAITAFIVALTNVFCSNVFAAELLLFYYSSSKLTKYKSNLKKSLEDQHQEGGNRNYIQVLSNSASSLFYSLLFHLTTSRLTTYIDYQYDYYSSFLLVCSMCHYACCNGDTWASELGILSKSQPILITKLKRVPKGTNGGVSTLGLIASFSGGAFIGLVHYVSTIIYSSFYPEEIQRLNLSNQFLSTMVLASFAGLFGSILDSIMGATLQYSAFSSSKNVVLSDENVEKLKNQKDIKHISGLKILDNHQVNFLSSLITALFCGYLGYFLY